MDMCPDTTALAPALNNYGAVSGFVSDITLTPATDTPTAEALTIAANSLSGHPGEKYVIVVTDGIPDTCASNDGICVADAVDAAQDAYSAGVTTILVTIGNDAFDGTPSDFKQSFANAGSGAPVATPPPEQMSFNCGNVMPTYADAGGTTTFYEIEDANIIAELGPTLAEIVGSIAQ
jgi:subtilisin family serine protease